MAHPLDSMLRSVAASLLAKGEPLTVKQVARSSFSASIGGYTAVTVSRSAVVGGYVDARETTRYGESAPKGFLAGDRKAYIPAKSLTFEPVVNDLITYNGVDWTIVQTQASNGYQDPVLWELTIRKGQK